MRLDSEVVLEDLAAGGAAARILLVDGHLVVVTGEDAVGQGG